MRFIWTIIFLLVAAPVWGATYYIEDVAGTTWRYAADAWPTAESTACSANDIQGCLDDLDGGGHTVILHPGTYSGADLDSATNLQANAANTTFRGPIAGDAEYSTHNTGVTIDASSYNDDAISIGNNTGWTVSNMTLTGAPTLKYGLKSELQSVNASDLDVVRNARGIYVKAGTFTRIRIRSCSDTPRYTVALLSDGETVVFNYCIFEDNVANITVQNGVSITFNNCIFSGFQRQAIELISGAAVFTFNNCIFSANGLYSITNQYIIDTSNSGTWTFNNCLNGDYVIGADAFIGANSGGATVTNNNNVTSTLIPGFKTNRDSRIFFSVDDSVNIDYWYTVADLADTYGYPTVMAIYKDSTYAPAINWETVSSYISNGHEIASHGVSNVRLDSMNAFTVTHAAATITISVDQSDSDSANWTGTFTLSTGESGNLHDAAYDTLGELTAYIDAIDGYTVDDTPTGQTNISEGRSVTLADVTGQSLAGGYTLQFDQTQLFQVEMKETKTWLESNIQTYIPGWTCKTFVHAGGNADTDSKTYALSTAGYSQARTAVLTANPSVLNYDMAYIPTQAAYQMAGAGAAASAVEKEAGGFIDAAQHERAIIGLYGHGSAEFPLTSWEAVFDAATALNATVSTISDAMDWLRANDDHVTDNVSYKCSGENDSCISEVFNYRLSAESSLIYQGTDVSLTSDYAGKPIRGATPNIGAYESWPGIF